MGMHMKNKKETVGAVVFASLGTKLKVLKEWNSALLGFDEQYIEDVFSRLPSQEEVSSVYGFLATPSVDVRIGHGRSTLDAAITASTHALRGEGFVVMRTGLLTFGDAESVRYFDEMHYENEIRGVVLDFGGYVDGSEPNVETVRKNVPPQMLPITEPFWELAFNPALASLLGTAATPRGFRVAGLEVWPRERYSFNYTPIVYRDPIDRKIWLNAGADDYSSPNWCVPIRRPWPPK